MSRNSNADTAPSIPLISLDDVDGFRSAFETFGFGVLRGDDDLVADASTLRTAAYSFFRSDRSFKSVYSSGGTYGPPGWAAQGLEAVARSREEQANFVPDAVESFVHHGPQASQNVPEMLKEPLEKYHATATQLLDRVMQTCALSQGKNADYFEPFYQKRSCSLRLAYYPAGSSSKYGAHTDYTGFTLLNTEKSGLQVLHDDVWIPVSSSPENIIVNAGDLLPIWTNGRFKSAVHRVVATEELETEDRLSVVFFTGPADDAVVEPIVLPGEQAKYESVVSGEHLRTKLARTNRDE